MELGFDMIQVTASGSVDRKLRRRLRHGPKLPRHWAVILGDVMRAACSGGDGFSMFSIGGPSGGSLDNRCFSIRGRFLGRAGLRCLHIRQPEGLHPGLGARWRVRSTLHGHGHAGDADDGPKPTT